MKKISVYTITETEFENTEYRQDVTTEEIETEDDWHYGDIVENMGEGYKAEAVRTCRDLIVWKITSFVDDEYCSYVVELL